MHCLNLNCGKEVKQAEGKRKRLYCSDKCRKAHKRKLAKADKSITDKTNPDTITDSIGNVHKIDYEGRQRTQAILDDWYTGKGTAYQQQLATLGRQYTKLKL